MGRRGERQVQECRNRYPEEYATRGGETGGIMALGDKSFLIYRGVGGNFGFSFLHIHFYPSLGFFQPYTIFIFDSAGRAIFFFLTHKSLDGSFP